MNSADWIGFIGVTILLAAYFLNLFNKLNKNSLLYIILNLSGAAVACIASILLKYWPFIVLEAAWTLVSLIALMTYRRK